MIGLNTIAKFKNFNCRNRAFYFWDRLLVARPRSFAHDCGGSLSVHYPYYETHNLRQDPLYIWFFICEMGLIRTHFYGSRIAKLMSGTSGTGY
jgi:hypothetical protein